MKGEVSVLFFRRDAKFNLKTFSLTRAQKSNSKYKMFKISKISHLNFKCASSKLKQNAYYEIECFFHYCRENDYREIYNWKNFFLSLSSSWKELYCFVYFIFSFHVTSNLTVCVQKLKFLRCSWLCSLN